MRHSIAVGVCLVIAAFAPGCPKDDNSGGGASSQDGGSSGGSGGQQQMSGAGHGDDTSHSGTGGSSTNSGGNHGGDSMHSGGTGGGGSAAHDAGAGDPGQGMTDAGSSTGGDIKDAGRDSGPADCDLKCDPGSHCELVQVACIQAPCPPQPECVPDAEKKFCGGFAGFDCPGGGTCVDDPSDDCDPMNGGADCGGMCVCDKAASCVQGKHWDGRPSVCDCVSDM